MVNIDMQSIDSEHDFLMELKDGLKRLWPGKVVMGKHTVFVSTKYGDVIADWKTVRFPSNPFTYLHEICHLFIPNHNLSFYRKLEDMCHAVGLIRNCGYVVTELGGISRYSAVLADENDWNNYKKTSAIISSWISKK